MRQYRRLNPFTIGQCSVLTEERESPLALLFVSKAFGEKLNDLGLRKNLSPVASCRNVSKLDMVLNDHLPTIEVDPESYEVRADGELLTCEPADCLPLAQRYFLF